MSKKIFIDRTLDKSNDDIRHIVTFVKMCSDMLQTTSDFTVYVVEDKKKYGIKTTAYYNPETHMICVLGKDRHFLDICRSIAHEMVHMSQHDKGLITGPIKDIGGFHEDQANAIAGQIVKSFIYKMKI